MTRSISYVRSYDISWLPSVSQKKYRKAVPVLLEIAQSMTHLNRQTFEIVVQSFVLLLGCDAAEQGSAVLLEDVPVVEIRSALIKQLHLLMPGRAQILLNRLSD